MITAYPEQGGGARLLTAVAAALPGRYQPHLTRGDSGVILTAADDRFAPVRGTIQETGQVQLTVETSCRAGRFPHQQPEELATVPPAARSTVLAAFTAFRLAPQRWSAVHAACPTGADVQLGAGVPAGAGVVTVGDRAEFIAYRTGVVGGVLRRSAGAITVTATVGCY